MSQTLKLKRGEKCPIHHGYFCCGRTQPRWPASRAIGKTGRAVRYRKPVERIEDPHHPRGYREYRNPAAMRLLLKKKIEEQHGLCGICGEPFTEISGIVPDHIEPRGMGGANRDDHPDNIQAAHNLCNLEKGSQREFKKRGAGQ